MWGLIELINVWYILYVDLDNIVCHTCGHTCVSVVNNSKKKMLLMKVIHPSSREIATLACSKSFSNFTRHFTHRETSPLSNDAWSTFLAWVHGLQVTNWSICKLMARGNMYITGESPARPSRQHLGDWWRAFHLWTDCCRLYKTLSPLDLTGFTHTDL